MENLYHNLNGTMTDALKIRSAKHRRQYVVSEGYNVETRSARSGGCGAITIVQDEIRVQLSYSRWQGAQTNHVIISANELYSAMVENDRDPIWWDSFQDGTSYLYHLNIGGKPFFLAAIDGLDFTICKVFKTRNKAIAFIKKETSY